MQSLSAAASRSFPWSSGPECPTFPVTEAVVRFACDCGPGASPECVAGQDGAPGTFEAPLRTYAKAREVFLGQDAGHMVAFCRGGSFTIEGERDWTNARCSSNQPCVVRDYQPPNASPGLAAPILRADQGDGVTLVNGGSAEHEEGFVFLNLDFRSLSRGKNGNGFFFYNDVDDVLLCGVSIDGFAIGVHAGGSNPPTAGSDGKNARIVLRSSRVTNNGDQGWLGGCDGCGIEYTAFQNNGYNRAILNHSIYFAGTASGMFARKNHLYRSAVLDGKCRGAPLVAHGQLTGLVIEDNTVREDLGHADASCWGIAVDTGYEDRSEAFRDVLIRGNDVLNVGNLGIGLNACQGCIIEKNLVVHEQPFGSTLIAVPDRPRSANDLEMGSVLVQNNTLISRSSAGAVGIRVGGEASGHVVRNNALLSVGTGRLTCFSYDLPNARYASREGNVCHASNGSAWTEAIGKLGAWQQASGADHSSSDADPRLPATRSRFRWTRLDGVELSSQRDSRD